MQPLLIVCVALSIEKLIPISSSIDPLCFFRFVCQRMAAKVLRQSYSPKQIVISGSLALMSLVVPLLVLVYIVLQFASYQWVLDIILLWILLQFTGNLRVVQRSVDALNANKKQLAKELLQQVLLRDTQTLSPLGLKKASHETVFLRYHHQQFTTILCYLLLGPISALCYRLCYEANQVWNIKLKAFRYFGRVASVITQIVQLPASLLMSITFILINNPKTLISYIQEQKFIASLKQALSFYGNQSLLLQTLSSALCIHTGGPLMYGGIKCKRPRYSMLNSGDKQENNQICSREPSTLSLNTLKSFINRHLIVSLIISTWILLWSYPN
jgi:adenosylcobinamide-phosphate synthase